MKKMGTLKTFPMLLARLYSVKRRICERKATRRRREGRARGERGKVSAEFVSKSYNWTGKWSRRPHCLGGRCGWEKPESSYRIDVDGQGKRGLAP